jgi:glycosyltransferase involved in cell wall biosynthesis
VKPLVSILIPAFDAQKYIEATLVSALDQTWPRTEIIVVDDGSTDRTLEAAERFASRGVKVVGQEHQGAAAARNHALSLSRGDYIQWLDADDLLAPDKIEAQLAAAGGARTLLSSAWGTFMSRPSHARFVPTSLWCNLAPLDWLLLKMEQNVFMQTATWLVSRELTEAAGPWDVGLSVDDDGEYFCRVLSQSDSTRFVGDARVFYRMGGTRNLSYVGGSVSKARAHLRSVQLHIACLLTLEKSERTRAACLRYLQNFLDSLCVDDRDIVGQVNQMAADLGARLEAPRLSWMYAWMPPILGRSLTRRARVVLPSVRWSVARTWDRTLSRLESPD